MAVFGISVRNPKPVAVCGIAYCATRGGGGNTAAVFGISVVNPALMAVCGICLLHNARKRR